MDDVKRSNRGTVMFVLIMVVAVAFVMLMRNGLPDSSSEPSPHASHCERSWENSSTKAAGGSRAVFMDRCRADLKTIQEATR